MDAPLKGNAVSHAGVASGCACSLLLPGGPVQHRSTGLEGAAGVPVSGISDLTSVTKPLLSAEICEVLLGRGLVPSLRWI